jgi:hypothetical protein
MSLDTAFRLLIGSVVALITPAVAAAYIHFPPTTLQKMCRDAHQIRLMKVKKFDKDKGVIVYEVAESLKGEKSKVTSYQHVIRAEAGGAKSILDWVADGKPAVMFSIEGDPRGKLLAIGYVFIDKYCYSVDYNSAGEYWLLIRGEPELSACYYGSVETLRDAVRAILDGKEVKVPVKEPGTKEDRDKRNAEVNEALNKNRSTGK